MASGRISAVQSLQQAWWSPGTPSVLSTALLPLSWVYDALRRLDGAARRARSAGDSALPVPVVVVGNLVVGGAGKTPTVIALVRALVAAGWAPGVVSRGYGRRTQGTVDVQADTPAADAGDEPALVHRATGAPVVVAARRLQAAQALLAAHPEVDVIVSDDGLQHLALPRSVEVVVFDSRGAGNGRLLPAGPLREPLPARLRDTPGGPLRIVLYTDGRASTPLPGFVAERALDHATPLAAWSAGSDAGAVRPEALGDHRPLLAIAGIAEPARFFDALERRGLEIRRHPLPDHHPLWPPPWPPSTTDVVLTEKDAVKLKGRDVGTTRVWVVGLDFRLPPAFVQAVLAELARTRRPCPSTTD